jgi:hypothetical protein
MIYEWLVFLHVLSVLLFMASHGVAISVAFRLKSASSRDAIVAMLDVSAATLVSMYVMLGLVLLTGITLAALGNWWGALWFWAALAVLVAIVAAMVPLGAIPFSRCRQAAGVPYAIKGKWLPAEPMDEGKLRAAVAAVRPDLLAIVGLGGLAIILWLMMFKPF